MKTTPTTMPEEQRAQTLARLSRTLDALAFKFASICAEQRDCLRAISAAQPMTTIDDLGLATAAHALVTAAQLRAARLRARATVTEGERVGVLAQIAEMRGDPMLVEPQRTATLARCYSDADVEQWLSRR